MTSIRCTRVNHMNLVLQDFDASVEIGPERPGKDNAYVLDSSKLRTELGWTDTISLEQGIDDVIAWVRRYEGALMDSNWDYVHKA